MPLIDGFPRPKWAEISAQIETAPEPRWPALWEHWAKKWLENTLNTLPPGYRIKESKNFLLVSAQNDRYMNMLTNFMEKALRNILRALSGIAIDDGFGPHILLMFDEQELYYRYVAHFYPEEGEYSLSSGTFLNAEYGHFVFPFVEMAEAEATSAHELTHACLRHLPIPLWLNEGLAVTMEDELCGSQPLRMDNERLREHRRFWDAETIQEFWSGIAFHRTDEGHSLSYELARYCVRALAHDYDAFAAFANNANYADGGDSAAIKVYGGGVGGLINQFFGDGNWSPEPAGWHGENVS